MEVKDNNNLMKIQYAFISIPHIEVVVITFLLSIIY